MNDPNAQIEYLTYVRAKYIKIADDCTAAIKNAVELSTTLREQRARTQGHIELLTESIEQLKQEMNSASRS